MLYCNCFCRHHFNWRNIFWYIYYFYTSI